MSDLGLGIGWIVATLSGWMVGIDFSLLVVCVMGATTYIKQNHETDNFGIEKVFWFLLAMSCGYLVGIGLEEHSFRLLAALATSSSGVSVLLLIQRVARGDDPPEWLVSLIAALRNLGGGRK